MATSQIMFHAMAVLQAESIRTSADLDRWIAARPQQDTHGPFLMSRYEALRYLCGEAAADRILQELSIEQCFIGAS
jgi:hypothetical protein